jgi:8-oxo-dGTP pyrophosphatase MutT (NUDIX family)
MPPSSEHADRLARWAKSGKEGTPPVEAATVILIRNGEGESAGELETLMLRRNSKIAFGGMWVFPGGRVDEGDRRPEDGEDDLEPARRAAVREAHEEAGVELAADVLVPFSHWTPPPITPRRFLTWFFLAATPHSDITIDGGEIHEHAWLHPAEVFRRREVGEVELAPPTFVTLTELAKHSDVESALEAVRARTPERFATRVSVEDSGPTALWFGDAGYEASDASLPGARHRLSMHGNAWHYQREGF